MEEALVPIAMFGCIAAVVIVPTLMKSRDRREMQATLRTAIERGQPVPPEVIEALTRDETNRRQRATPTALSDIRSGVLWLATGLGLAGLGAMLGIRHDDALHPILGVSIIPSVIGVALIVLSFFNPNKEPRV